MTIVGASCIAGNIACLILAAVYLGAGAAALVALATVFTMIALADLENRP